MEIIKADTHFDFVRMMKPNLIMSLAVIIIGIASLIWHGGPNYGIDFAGGSEIPMRFETEGTIDYFEFRGHHQTGFKPLFQRTGDHSRWPRFSVLLCLEKGDISPGGV